MKRTRYTYLALAILLFLFVRSAHAGFLPSPFEFSFFTRGLTSLFLLPFQLAGCG